MSRAVAWRVKDFADGWILCHTEAQAMRESRDCGNLVQPLYLGTPDEQKLDDNTDVSWTDEFFPNLKG